MVASPAGANRERLSVKKRGTRQALGWCVAVLGFADSCFCCQATAPRCDLADGSNDSAPRTLPAGNASVSSAQQHERQLAYLKEHYLKREYRVPMRDGVRLFTTLLMPKDTSRQYPILMRRTPYSVAPYEEDRYPEYPWYIGPPQAFAEEGYIFAVQDVRGRFMSEGEFVNVRPHIARKAGTSDIDESTDTYDTIEWLLHNLPNHNGRVGMWGISYPGFYAAAGMIDAHPALKAVSPQAPVADWFFDDFHHHGAFFLADAFDFFAVFARPRPGPTTEWEKDFNYGTPDAYQFFLELGPLKNANERYFKGGLPFWNDLVEHPDYDAFWQARNILPHLRNVAPAVMTVGGWFDAEDLYGPLKTYQAIERQNPTIFNILVMGPWFHGGWDRSDGEKISHIRLGSQTSHHYRENMELPFFNFFLKDKGQLKLPEAYMFETGANRWRTFDHWPPPVWRQEISISMVGSDFYSALRRKAGTCTTNTLVTRTNRCLSFQKSRLSVPTSTWPTTRGSPPGALTSLPIRPPF